MADASDDTGGKGKSYVERHSVRSGLRHVVHRIVDPERWTLNNPLVPALLELSGKEGQAIFQPDFVVGEGERGPMLKRPKDYNLRDFRVQDLHLETGENVTAWYHPPKDGFPTVVYCHGTHGALDARVGQLREFGKRGFGVMIAAYPGLKGHHRKLGIQPTEKACIETARAMVLYLVNQKLTPKEVNYRGEKPSSRHAYPQDDPMKHIVLFGESLGASVALQTAFIMGNGEPAYGREALDVPAVICWAPFTSLVERAHEAFPKFNAKMWLQNPFETKKIMPLIHYDKTKVLLMHGLDDDFTLPHHSSDLQERSGRPENGAPGYNAEVAFLEGCNHGSVYPGTFQRDPEQLRKIGNTAQNFLHKLGLCPPVPAELELPIEARADTKAQAQKQSFQR